MLLIKSTETSWIEVVRVIPYQINKKKSGSLSIFMKFGHKHGPYQETFSRKKLAHFIGLPLSYDHSKFLLESLFCLHVFNKMATTLHVIDLATSGLEF